MHFNDGYNSFQPSSNFSRDLHDNNFTGCIPDFGILGHEAVVTITFSNLCNASVWSCDADLQFDLA